MGNMGKVKQGYKKWTEEEIETAKILYGQGESFASIGREIGRPKVSVTVKLKALGIKSNKKMLWEIESLRPHIINVDEAKQTTAQSNKKLLFKCGSDDCENTKMIVVQNLVNRGFSCPNCSTGTSYPELFMLAVNQYFNLGYEYQVSYEHGRFDFINHDTKTVVEMNGRTHYEDNGYMNHEATKLSDNKKRKWCKENGYTLIFIDARESTFKFIQDNINNCELLPNITESDIPKLLEIIEKNRRYPVKEIIDAYVRARKSTVKIAEIYGYDDNTIVNILRKNNIELRDNNASKGKKVRCIETGVVYASILEAGRKLEINQGHISECCNGKRKSAGGYHWEYLSDIEANAHHRAQLVAEQDELDTIQLDSSIDLLAMFNQRESIIH